MNKRQLKKVITLYREGLSCEICISAILDLMKKANSVEKAISIHTFYETIFNLSIKQTKEI